MVKLSFLGAAGQVTGSNFLIYGNSSRYVVDCGLFQGGKELTAFNNDQFKYKPSEVDAVILTHAHLDHVGRLPMLVANGFNGPIYSTSATLDLAELVLKDSFHIMKEKNERYGDKMLYDNTDLNRTIAFFEPINYYQSTKLQGNDWFTLYDAGHILGSCSILVRVDKKHLVFSGDLGSAPNLILKSPEIPISADAVVVEGTYGSVERLVPTKSKEQTLIEVIEWAIQHKGVVLIPAFSIERTQELIFLFRELFYHRHLPRIPIFLDSPLAIEAIDIFERNLKLLNDSARLEHSHDQDLFAFRNLIQTPTVNDSKTINTEKNPKIIIAGSGMMAGGRIIHHLARYLDKPNTLLLVIGYQAEGTLGRQIIQRPASVKIFGRNVPINARIEVADIFSAHADHTHLLNWLKKIKPRNGVQYFVVHSEKVKAELFADMLQKLLGQPAHAPAFGDEVELGE